MTVHEWDEPLDVACSACHNFDCVYWVEVNHIAECRSCGATLEEVFYIDGLYAPPRREGVPE